MSSPLQERLEPIDEQAEASPDALHDELQMEILRLRDLVAGMEGQLGAARGRIEELSARLERYTQMEHRLNEQIQLNAQLEQRLDDVLGSNSWRLAQAAGLPLRRLRERKG